MSQNVKPVTKVLSKKDIDLVSKKYTTRLEFFTKNYEVYQAAVKLNILKEVCSHMEFKESIGEQLVRKTFNHYFKETFIKVHPKWLINPKTKSRLELDGYNEKLKIAFEVNGIHHYAKSFTRHTDVKFKDELKKKLCKIKKIKLYSIKYKSMPKLIDTLTDSFKVTKPWLEKNLKEISKQTELNYVLYYREFINLPLDFSQRQLSMQHLFEVAGYIRNLKAENLTENQIRRVLGFKGRDLDLILKKIEKITK